MKGHLFEEELKQLNIVLSHVSRVRKQILKMSDANFVLKHEIAKTEIALEDTISQLELSILNYENGITEDIDKTKKEILERLKRL